MRLSLFLVIVLMSLGLLPAAESIPSAPSKVGPETTQAEKVTRPPVDVKRMRFADALEQGAAVYVCTITKVEPVAHQSPTAVIQQGNVTFAISETLRGENRSTLTLPYYAVGGGSFDYVWRIKPEVGPLRFIVVVVPNAYESYTPKIPGIAEAIEGMEYVGDNEANLSEVKAFLKLFDAKSSPVGVNTTGKDSSDGKSLAQVFSLMMTPLQFTSFGSENAGAITDQFNRISDPAVASAALGLINSVLKNPGYNKNCSFYFCQLLTKLAQNQTPVIRQQALAELSTAATILSTRYHVHLVDGLNAADISALQKVLDAEAISQDAVVLRDVSALRAELVKK